MSKQRPPRFRDVWVNQTELGKHFNMSAIAMGKKLVDLGLRTAAKEPTELATAEGYCQFTPMKDGTPFYLWNKAKVASLLRSSGVTQLSRAEVQARDTAQALTQAYAQAEATGIDKLWYFVVDEVKQRDYPLVNRFLAELGSSIRLGEADKA
jgi:hypothetical protein